MIDKFFQLPMKYAYLVHLLSSQMGFVMMKIIKRIVSLMAEIVASMFEMNSVLIAHVILVI